MLLDGSGVALADINGDGRVDLFFGAANGGSQLWQNDGDWHFHDITGSAIPERSAVLAGDVTGVVLADLNGDRAPDLVLNTHADGIRILMNDGHGVFHRFPLVPSRARGGHSVALADMDGDGWVDIYVCNYRQRALMDMPSARATFRTVQGVQTVATIDGRPTTDPDLTNRFVVTATGGMEETGEPDVLYRNLGGTNFVEVAWTEGGFLDEDGRALTAPPRDWGLAAQFCDVNDDGRPDLYVCNDFQTPDRLWLNESTPGKIRFRLAPRSALRHTSLFSMGVDFADVNRDSRWDFAVLDMLSPDHVRRLTTLDGTPSVVVNPRDPRSRPQLDANTLYLQRRDGSFAEVGAFAGVTATDWSWAPAFLDVDLDGWPDLLLSAGQERGSRDLDFAEHMKVFRKSGLRTDAQIFRERQKVPGLPAPLKAFRNRGIDAANDVPTFEDVSGAWGFDFVGVSHGLALADLDGDGDLDVVVNHLQSPAGLYRNEGTASRISVRLKGQAPNTAALGARMRFWWWNPERGVRLATLPQSAQVVAGGRYLSSDAPGKTFACPGPGQGFLEIRWPSGRTTTSSNLVANQHYECEETPGVGELVSSNTVSPPLSGRLHFDAAPTVVASGPSSVEDFALQPLLPRRQSTRSPSLALAGLGTTNRVLWLGGPDQAVQRVDLSAAGLSAPRSLGAVRSTTALAAWGEDLLVGSTGANPRNPGQASVVWMEAATGAERLVTTNSRTVACLSVRDRSPTNGTFVLVGGGAMPAEYPNSAVSELLQFEGGSFHSRAQTNLGLVNAAVFTQLTPDSGVEWVTVGEWAAPRILRWKGTELQEWDAPVTWGKASPLKLSSLTGWWQSVVTADFDQDGRMDLVLGNWGLNSAYALYAGPPSRVDGRVRPLLLYHGNLDPGAHACIEAYTAEAGRVLPIHGLTELANQLPWLGGQFPSFQSFAKADIGQVLGEPARGFARRECHWLSSLILLNRGDHFEARPLPDLAQLGPVFALQAADFDGDGHLDLYGGQGFFGHNFGVPRDDAGEGFLLLGRGDGNFDAVTTPEVGFRVLGEQRAAVVTDVDGDRRPDLIVGEYGGPVTLFLNRSR